MSKFRVLEHNERFVMCLGIPSYRFANELSSNSSSFYHKLLLLLTTHSDRLTELTNDFFGSIPSYYVLLIAFSIPVSSAIFVCKNWPELDVISDSCLAFFAGLEVFGMLLSFGIRINKTKDIHRQLQEIIDEQGDYEL